MKSEAYKVVKDYPNRFFHKGRDLEIGDEVILSEMTARFLSGYVVEINNK